MRNSILTLAMILCSQFCFGQFQIGHTTITFNDPSRTGGFGTGGGPGRQIQAEIYYPANTAGENVSLASGEFPVIVFGHGFAMGWDSYDNIWNTIVPEGYIIVFPRTEGSLFPSPSHSEFALDLALVETKMTDEGNASSSLFFNHISTKSAIMGHSMGGGASFLAAANNSSITTVIGLAPAETTPSAITASANVSVPALVFSADEDFVTPPVDHHVPIYNGLNSTCKYFINIMGGAHCYYANANFSCDFGESSSGGNIGITRTQQQNVLFRYLLPWLNLYLYDDCNQQNTFTNDLALDSEVTFQNTCSGFSNPIFNLNVTINAMTLISDQSGTTYQWIDCDNGNTTIPTATQQSFTATQAGNYAVILGTGICADTSGCYQVNALGIENIYPETSDKTIIEIVDYLGRKTEYKINTPLILIYSDGTRKKIYKIEN